MGCGDSCPYYPGKRYEDWVIDDPAGQDLDHVRPIRNQIRQRVENLIAEILPLVAGSVTYLSGSLICFVRRATRQ
jgi:arsenate reductase (thioredoxin)